VTCILHPTKTTSTLSSRQNHRARRAKDPNFAAKNWGPLFALRINLVAAERLSENRQKQAPTKLENRRVSAPCVRDAVPAARLNLISNKPARAPATEAVEPTNVLRRCPAREKVEAIPAQGATTTIRLLRERGDASAGIPRIVLNGLGSQQ
jgi:hypothetical protein